MNSEVVFDFVRVITGPTGARKSWLAERLAKECGWAVANADAFQFYKEIPVIGAQPALGDIPYRYLSHLSVRSPWTAGDFARETVHELTKPHLWVGTGLYLGAALWGLDPHRTKGTPFQTKPRQKYRMIVLNPDRKWLYQQLDDRVNRMIERSAIEEVKMLERLVKHSEISAAHPLLKAIGVRQLLGFLREEYSYDEAIRLWKRDTRRLAKRQWTWLRKFSPPSDSNLWISFRDSEDLLTQIASIKSFLALPSRV